jgi:hypothetical protein
MASFETRSPSEKHQRLAAALSEYILTYASHRLWLGTASLFTLQMQKARAIKSTPSHGSLLLLHDHPVTVQKIFRNVKATSRSLWY